MRLWLGMGVALGLFAQAAAAQTQSQAGAPSNPFLGSVPKGTATAERLALSAKDAVQRALQNNLGLLLQEESEATAHGARWQALADLLPNVNGSLTARRQIINLQAFGFPANPPRVGPFNLYDARVFLSQPVLDLAALDEHRAASLNEQAAKYGVRTARDLVVLVTVNLYLEAVAQSSRVEMVHAQLQTAEELLKQAQDLKAAGLVASLDVVRAQVQRETQRQRSISAENAYRMRELQLRLLEIVLSGERFREGEAAARAYDRRSGRTTAHPYRQDPVFAARAAIGRRIDLACP